MAALNSPAPDFSLPDLSGKTHRLSDSRGGPVILCMWSARCPWSQRIDRALEDWPAGLASGAALWRLAVNADESADEIRARAGRLRRGILLLDSNRAAADLYAAQTTPEFFLVDREGILRYRGAFDDSDFRVRVPTRFYLADALRALLAGRSPDPAGTPAYGCAIERWKM
jgi:peroxiredoxin